MAKRRTAKELEILESTLREELDFITYVDVKTQIARVIVTNEDAHVLPPEVGDYNAFGPKSIKEFIHSEDLDHVIRQLALENIKKELESKERFILSFRLLCGEVYRRKELSIYYHGKDKSTLVIVRRDITDSYEEELEQRERLYQALMDARHANQEKNELLEHMSHEIRTPMNSIIGLSYLIGESVDEKEQMLEHLDKINMSARFLLSFINDILDLSQIESGNVTLMRENIDFDAFLECIKQNIAEKAQAKGITFSTEQRGTFRKEYSFDAEKLQKALLNLLDNSVQFTGSGGKIEFIVEALFDHEGEATVRFEIRDTGIGIDSEFLPYIFEPFEKEASDGAKDGSGTGLGLAVARNTIEYMEGRIDVYSKKGKGSTFVVTVPLEYEAGMEDDEKGQPRAERTDYDFTGKRVLLVEDNEINIEITRNLLKHKNFEVDVAVNGEEGIARYFEHEPGYYDVILMDIRMPVMDGLAAAKRIRGAERSDSMRVPIVAMTGNVFEEDVRKSFEAGMDAHLTKPVDIKQMYFTLDSLLFG